MPDLYRGVMSCTTALDKQLGEKQKLSRELIKGQCFLVFIVCVNVVCVSKESLLILLWGKPVVSSHLHFWWEGIHVLLHGIWHIVNDLWEESTVSKDCQNLVWIKSWLVKGDLIRERYSLYSGSISITLSPFLYNLSLELSWNERDVVRLEVFFLNWLISQ